ncbi:MAG: hypothetical protein M1835_005749 [Candelina submexicana]|nr:MAG: hypothetical protein M1835_005749 [Candelina submexicana]
MLIGSHIRSEPALLATARGGRLVTCSQDAVRNTEVDDGISCSSTTTPPSSPPSSPVPSIRPPLSPLPSSLLLLLLTQGTKSNYPPQAKTTNATAPIPRHRSP